MQNYPEAWGDETKRLADAIARLNELKSRGVDTIVDLTVIGLGRYIPRIAKIAAQTDLNIVVATGLYTYNDVPMYFHFRGPGTPLGGPEIWWTCSSATSRKASPTPASRRRSSNARPTSPA